MRKPAFRRSGSTRSGSPNRTRGLRHARCRARAVTRADRAARVKRTLHFVKSALQLLTKVIVAGGVRPVRDAGEMGAGQIAER